ncbi:MAG: PD-(D/E)XK nuclease family protein [Blastocatellia bacterium]|nr:PD-(D/E)XK nuclease family protein [Blastocatellia bacterium]
MTTPLREIWLGPALGRQRELLIERCREHLRQGSGNEILYLAASRPLMLEVYDRMVDGREIRGNLGALPIHLFTGFIAQVLKSARLVEPDGMEIPLPRRDRIDVDIRPLQRPLLSQVMMGLAANGRIPHFGALAKSDGCVESVADLIGEIQRAGKTSAAFRTIVEDRIYKALESSPMPDSEDELQNGLPPDVDDAYGYERDVALIYECYQRALHRNGLTEINEDHLRVLRVLEGEYEGTPCVVPYIKPVQMLVVDGFFDFTPAQGEILKRLIARIPEVIFNFDFDVNNVDVFRPIEDTIEHVEKMADTFERKVFHHHVTTALPIEIEETHPDLEPIRQGLFNTQWVTPIHEPDFDPAASTIPVFRIETPDREREIRTIAKEIKNLVLLEGFKPSEIAVALREKTSYGADVRRVFTEEGITFSFDERLKVADVPAVRAVRKLLDATASRLPEDEPGKVPHIPVAKLVGVLKSDYFHLPGIAGFTSENTFAGMFAAEVTVDDIENVVAYVGQQLHLDDWLARAARLLGKPDSLLTGTKAVVENSQTSLPFEEIALHQDMLDELPETVMETGGPKKVQADAIGPNQILVTARILATLGQTLLVIPYEAEVAETAAGFEKVLQSLRFKEILEQSIKNAHSDPEKMLRATLDLRGLEAISRGVAAVQDAVRFAWGLGSGVSGLATESQSLEESQSSVLSPQSSIRVGVFRDELGRSLETQQLRVQPETFGAVRILEVTDLRGLTFRCIFVPGLIEGGFPMRGRADWIYPPAERESLKEYGLTLEDISPAVIRKEEHYFYQATVRATEKLYLTRPKSTDDETETVMSYFLAELERVYPPGLFQEKEGESRLNIRSVQKGYDGSSFLDSTSARELARTLAAVRRRLKQGEPVETFALPFGVLSPREVVETVDKFSNEKGYVTNSAHRRLDVEAERYGKGYGIFDGLLDDEDVRAATTAQFGAERVFSATEFNEYGQCPFRFFAHRVLNLRPRVEAALDLQSQDRGLLLHEVLREFFDKERGKPLTGRNIQELRWRLQQAAERVFERFERRLPPLNPKLWEIERSVLMLQLERLLDYEIETESATAQPMRPRFGEVAFGMKSFSKHQDPASIREPLVLRNEGGEMIRLRGQIDRVDASGDGKLLAYDYKSSRGPSLQDMKAGRDVQLAIYLEALEHLFARDGEEVIGGGYYALRGGTERRNNGLYRAEYAGYTGISSQVGSSLSNEEWKELRQQMVGFIWEYWQRIRSGDFRVKPAQNETTCQYCDYKVVCRFDRYRIQRKRKSSEFRL